MSRAILALWTTIQGAVVLQSAETNIVQFSQPAPYSSEEEIGRRFGFAIVPDYDLAQAHFRVVVPPRSGTNDTLGLLVWLSPGDDGYFPPVWGDELAAQHLILVAPLQCGDQRHPIDRLRLALDATCNVCRKYKINRGQIFVGGYEGGAGIASMLGIGCGDIFTGSLCICGVNFHVHVPVGGTEYYPGSFFPNPEVVQYARSKGRFVLLTGEGDPNLDRMRAIADRGFRRDGFKHVLLLEVPGIRQSTPEVATLKQALSFLEGNDTTVSVSNTSADRK